LKTGFGRHYMADLYLCQNAWWETPDDLETEINRLTTALSIDKIAWRFETLNSQKMRISGEINDASYILIQVFPDQSFLTVDIFSWFAQLDLPSFSEGLLNIFAPQVVAAETKIRAEHLQSDKLESEM
jgi:S-adenosylmethionine/arginine decarboxylase-like enzyme